MIDFIFENWIQLYIMSCLLNANLLISEGRRLGYTLENNISYFTDLPSIMIVLTPFFAPATSIFSGLVPLLIKERKIKG